MLGGMTLPKSPRGKARSAAPFDAQVFLDSSGLAKTIRAYGRGETIFTQGDACDDVMYIQTGGIKLSVLSRIGKEAVLAVLGPGEFFGEGGPFSESSVSGLPA